ncbi:UvrD-helicase domain-containing protein [Crocinitomicaceae bacterium]|nr:UvrD-helicase domain-containing protein [Crocinitomicaceae bacterium]
MIQSSDKPLQILSASAGSGKTYRLVLTYLELLFTSKKPEPFSHIVAMTFTNKAALEMKTRIISALEIMSFPSQFEKSEKKYEDILCETLKISPTKLEKKSRRILLKILHRYEDFKVLTIDKFNLRLIRSFAKELDLPADFEVIIKEDEVLENVVDQLLNDLGTPNHEKITKLVLGYAEVKLKEGEKWNFRKDLIEFLAILKQEKHQPTVDKLMLYEFTNEDFQSIQLAIKKLRDKFKLEVDQLLSLLNKLDFFSESYKVAGASNSKNPLAKLKGQRGPEALFLTVSAYKNLTEGNRTNPPNRTLAEEIHRLSPIYEAIYNELELLFSVRNNYHNMWLLQLLAVRLEQMRKNDSLIRISEFNSLIGDLVQNEEAPFLYERIGNRYDHYLLDEFQDTSRMQWLNLVPLVHNGIANMNLNFIVGDPKQSIYRFKNGIAEQFVVLPQIYNPDNDGELAIKSAYFDELGEKNQIKQNWRSTKTIIEFNNVVFSHLGNNLPEETKDFYQDIIQETVSNKTGYVHVQGFNKKEFPEEKGNEVIQTLAWIEEILADGFLPKDITVLGRRNSECNRWAAHLIEAGYKVISADSLFVNSDIMVQWIISYMEKRRTPGNENVSKKFISQTLLVKRLSLSTYEEYLESQENTRYKKINEAKFLLDFYQSEADFYFNYQSINDLVMKFCDLVKIDPLENHYVHHLLDMAFQFDLRYGPDLQLFLEQYKQSGYKSPVQLPESDDAMTVMSIHKSKGLEFPVVILPHVSMTNPDKDKEKYYVEIEGRPSLLDSKKTAKIDGFEHYPMVEATQIMTDNLNLYYVAFTRAKTRLYVRNLYEAHKEEEKLHAALEENFETGWNENHTEFKIGERLPKITKDEDNREKVSDFVPAPLRDFLWFPSIALEKNNRQEEYTMSEAQIFGNQLHLLLSEVEKLDEIQGKLDELIDDGEISYDNRERILTETKRVFSDHLTELYASQNRILSEKNILFSGEKNSRPDKILIDGKNAIVLDFKTGEPRKSYEKQVNRYAELLEKMGFENVRKGLLYTEISKLSWME